MIYSRFGEQVRIIKHDLGNIDNGDRIGVIVEYYDGQCRKQWADELKADGGINEIFDAIAKLDAKAKKGTP